MENFIYNQYSERLAIFKYQKYQNLWMNNKVRGRDVASTTIIKYKYPELKYKCKYKYSALKYKYLSIHYKYRSSTYEYFTVMLTK